MEEKCEMNKTDISIITPVYKGNKYLPNLVKYIEEAAKNVGKYQVEWLLVNDFPEEKVDKPESHIKNLKIRLINNERNLDEYIKLDESVVMYYFHMWEDEKDPILSDLCQRFMNRRLFKYVRNCWRNNVSKLEIFK